jgi:hypothetical protein
MAYEQLIWQGDDEYMTSLDAEQLKNMMMEAVKAVESANVPDDLRATAFEKSLDALMGAAGLDAAPVNRRKPSGSTELVEATNGPSLNAIASRLDLDLDLVSELYYVDGDSLNLALAASKLNPKKAAGTQQIAMLVAAGRQAGGWDEWTHVARIRDVCRDYGRFDGANFASTIKRMGDVFSFRGRPRQLEVRLTRPGYERAADLARELGEV